MEVANKEWTTLQKPITNANDAGESIKLSIKNKSCLNIRRRYIVSVMTFLGIFLIYALRINLSVAIVMMTKNYTVDLINGTHVQVSDFTWSPKEKGYILSSFFYGYLFSQIPSGIFSARYGGILVLGIGVLLTSLFTIVLPLLAHFGLFVILIIRILTGLCEGGAFPCIQAICSRWTPASERARMVGITCLGGHCAITLCMFFYGAMAEYFGWKSLFYIPGAVALAWCWIWFAYIKRDPSVDPRISEEELHYIQHTVQHVDRKKLKHPWKEIFTSAPVWTIIITNFIECWNVFILITESPTLFNDLYHWNIEDAGLASGIPFAITIIGIPAIGVVSDYFRNTNSKTLVIKIFSIISHIGQGCCMTLIGYSPSAVVTILLITGGCFFNCVNYGAFHTNFLDIAPAHASVIMGISNTVGCFAGVICPLLVGYTITYQGMNGWRTVFIICGILNAVGAIVNLLFASGKIQPWARQKTDQDFH